MPSPPLPRRLNDRRAPGTARDRSRAPGPACRAMPRRVRSCRSRFSSWLMASGMARSHRGFAGTGRGPQRRVAAGPAGGGVNGFARATSARAVDPPRDALVAATGRRQRFRTGWRPPSRRWRARAPASSNGHGADGAAPVPRVAASASMSTGRHPDPARSPRPQRPFPRSGRHGRTRPFTTPPRSRGVRLRFCATDQDEAPAEQPWSPPPTTSPPPSGPRLSPTRALTIASYPHRMRMRSR